MILEEFNLEFHINNEKAISFEDGLEKGLAKGRAEGHEKGLVEGRAKEIFDSVSEGDNSVSRGAQKMNLTEEEFIKQMEAAGYKVPCGV